MKWAAIEIFQWSFPMDFELYVFINTNNDNCDDSFQWSIISSAVSLR